MIDRLLEIGTYFDWTALPRTVIGSVRRHKSVSPATLLGLNDWPFFMPAGYGSQAAAILEGYEIETWGKGSANDEDFFRVRKDQAQQAEAILIGAGIPLYHRSALGGEAEPADEVAGLDAEMEGMEAWLRF